MRHVLPLLACLVPCLAHAATFQSFDVPGAYGTCGSAIASNGLVAGDTVEPLAVGTTLRATTQSAMPFLYAAGQFSFPHANLPAGTVTFTGVNKDRFITGGSFNNSITSPVSTSFVYHYGAITTPMAGIFPVSAFTGITDRGALLGQVTIKTPLQGGFDTERTIGFLRAPNGQVTTIDDGSSYVSPRGTDARADHVVGYSFGNTNAGWVFSAGVFAPVNFPGASLTIPAGIDARGTITGSYLTGDPSTPASLVGHGFFLRDGTYTTYDVPRPGVTTTYIQGMNEAEQITGCYTDAKGTHGFLRTP